MKVLLNLLLGFIIVKHCRINFCNSCAFFCMLPLKTARLYKSEIAFILIFVEGIFADVNLKKVIQHSWRRIFILQKTLWLMRRNNKFWYKLNKFLPQNEISGSIVSVSLNVNTGFARNCGSWHRSPQTKPWHGICKPECTVLPLILIASDKPLGLAGSPLRYKNTFETQF